MIPTAVKKWRRFEGKLGNLLQNDQQSAATSGGGVELPYTIIHVAGKNSSTPAPSLTSY